MLGDGDGNDRVNVTRYKHDVDNVNDDDFNILNKNELIIQARLVCSTEERQSTMNLFAKLSPTCRNLVF